MLGKFSKKLLAKSLFFFFLPLFALASVTSISVSLSNSNPLPGSSISVTVNYCQNDQNHAYQFALAINGNQNAFQPCDTAGQNFKVDGNGVDVGGTGLGDAHYYGGYVVAAEAAGCYQMIWNITVPSSLIPGQTYYVIVGGRSDYLDCNTSPDQQNFIPITIQLPPPSSTLTKTAEAAATAPGALVLFSMNYTFVNTTSFTVTDTVPLNTTFVSMSPGGSNSGGNLTWNIYNGVAGAQQSGTVWFLAQVNTSATNGLVITNTATGVAAGATDSTGTASTTVAVPNLTLNKSQSPASSAAAGDSVTYTLGWAADGQSLQWFDSYDASSGSPSGFDGTAYNVLANGGQNGTWTLTSDGNGGQFITANGGGQYPTLLRSTPLNTCSNYTVEGDLYVNSSSTATQDATMAVGFNGLTGASADGYFAGISVDDGPAHVFLQTTLNGTASFPSGAQDHSMAIQYGAWYTMKVQVTQSGSGNLIQIRAWPKGTTEPGTWNVTYTDPTPPSCNPSLNFVGWQADNQTDQYDNLKVFAPGPVVNYNLTDSQPSGITYSGSSAVTATSAPSLSWSFPGTFFGQPSPLTWWGQVACPGPINNQFGMDASATGISPATSNTVSLDVTGSCNTPTITPTPTVTSTPTITDTPTATPSGTVPPTNTPTDTPTPTATKTVTSTPTITPIPPPGLHVWPNPFDPSYAVGRVVKASMVPAGATMDFYTVSGELVRSLTESGGEILWDGRNLFGNMVSTGTYFYVIKSGETVLLKGKLLVLMN